MLFKQIEQFIEKTHTGIMQLYQSVANHLAEIASPFYSSYLQSPISLLENYLQEIKNKNNILQTVINKAREENKHNENAYLSSIENEAYLWQIKLTQLYEQLELFDIPFIKVYWKLYDTTHAVYEYERILSIRRSELKKVADYMAAELEEIDRLAPTQALQKTYDVLLELDEEIAAIVSPRGPQQSIAAMLHYSYELKEEITYALRDCTILINHNNNKTLCNPKDDLHEKAHASTLAVEKIQAELNSIFVKLVQANKSLLTEKIKLNTIRDRLKYRYNNFLDKILLDTYIKSQKLEYKINKFIKAVVDGNMDIQQAMMQYDVGKGFEKKIRKMYEISEQLPALLKQADQALLRQAKDIFEKLDLMTKNYKVYKIVLLNRIELMSTVNSWQEELSHFFKNLPQNMPSTFFYKSFRSMRYDINLLLAKLEQFKNNEVQIDSIKNVLEEVFNIKANKYSIANNHPPANGLNFFLQKMYYKLDSLTAQVESPMSKASLTLAS